ncbi:isochorismatase family protein [Nakamurella lactea]|uniref:isochorismatase family protein n=1 Tax=Nakamurella lactea TaxID=459515 RepID=UPI000418A960|nr:isochorismatase family protein [Nakamurella lactea]
MTATGRADTGYSGADALIVVDMQRDFADPAGSLYVDGGEQTIAPIAAEIAAAKAAGATVVFTQDWHPEHTPHFAIDGGIWPVHCVMGTPGADLVPGLLPAGEQPEHVVRKGSGPEDGYSGFSVLDIPTGERKGTELQTLLDRDGVRKIVVVGLAGDWCVKATAIDGAEIGYQVTVPLALTRFVELEPGDGERAVAAMREAGVTLA